MYTLDFNSYTFAVVGLKRKYNREFATREDANKFMYKLCSKHDLKIKEVWNDHHAKTYHCTNGVTFYIQRAN